MSEPEESGEELPVGGRWDVRGSRAFILGGLSGGHGVFHWYLQSFLVALPHIKKELFLSNVQVGLLIAVREGVSGLVNIPGGFLTDIFRRHWSLIMAGCMAGLGLGYIALGWVPNYDIRTTEACLSESWDQGGGRL